MDKPLLGRRVVVTRAAHQAGELSAKLRALGAEPIEYPVIAIAPPEDLEQLDRAVSRAAHGAYDWIVLTSANGVTAVAGRLAALGLAGTDFGGARIAAIGPATAEAVRSILGCRVAVVPPAYVAEVLAEALGDVRGQRILLARADIARPALPQALREAGAQVDEVAAYRTVIAREGPDVRAMLARGQIDVVTFTSSSTVRNFVARVGRDALPYLSDVVIACIGPITASTARELGLSPAIVAQVYTVDGLLESLVQYYAHMERSP
ncbi:MAG: uroporphyrinogen-III synthase [Chloroflexi bacterium]|nr:uroporphyrinogen-III synthase [Chloroflexota bacterium]